MANAPTIKSKEVIGSAVSKYLIHSNLQRSKADKIEISKAIKMLQICYITLTIELTADR